MKDRTGVRPAFERLKEFGGSTRTVQGDEHRCVVAFVKDGVEDGPLLLTWPTTVEPDFSDYGEVFEGFAEGLGSVGVT
ncbi:hypothetical protein ASE25_05920 [Terrabacter sp. Root85]|nr:hypothetical protein ASE25_05920 [Terrabacter sp. Root85]